MSPTSTWSGGLQGVSAPMAAIFLISSTVPAVSASSPAQAYPHSAQPMTAMPHPIVRGASSANVVGNLSISQIKIKVCSSATTVGSGVFSSWSSSPSGTLGTRPTVAKASSPKGSCSIGESQASVSAGSDGSSSSAVSALFGGAAVWKAPA